MKQSKTADHINSSTQQNLFPAPNDTHQSRFISVYRVSLERRNSGLHT